MNNYIKLTVVIIFMSSLFGYTFVSSFGIILGIDNRQLVIPYRAMISFFSLILLLVCFRNYSKNINTDKKIVYFFVIISFVLLFLARSFLDSMFYLNNVDYEVKLEYWLFLILVTLLPSASFALSFKYVKEYTLVKWGMYAGFASVTTSIISYLGTVGYDFSMLYSGRMSLSVLNPITIGHAGLSLILLSYVFLTRYNSVSFFNRLIAIASYLIGFLALIAAGSRGPFLSLIVCLIFLLLLKDIRIKTIFYIILTAVLIVLIASLFDIYIFERLMESFLKDEARDSILQDSFILIMDNFFIGSGIFAMDTYPHNLIVESFLVLGLFGFFLFTIIFTMNFYYAFIMYKRALNIIFPLLYIQYCVFYMVSGTISEALMFWTLTFCFLFFNFKKPYGLIRNKEIV